MGILQKGTVSAEFRAIRPKLCGNCAYPQNFHTKKLGEIAVFYALVFTVLVNRKVNILYWFTYFKGLHTWFT